MMNYGMGQRINPHTLRVGVISNFDYKWYEDEVKDLEDSIVDKESSIFLKNKLSHNSNLSISNSGLFVRKIKLVKIFGNHNYKKVINKIKNLSR